MVYLLELLYKYRAFLVILAKLIRRNEPGPIGKRPYDGRDLTADSSLKALTCALSGISMIDQRVDRHRSIVS